MDSTNPFPFLQLPVELRLMVYEHLLSDPTPSTRVSFPAILTVDREIYTEAFKLYPSYLEAHADLVDEQASDVALYRDSLPARSVKRMFAKDKWYRLKRRARKLRLFAFSFTKGSMNQKLLDSLALKLDAGEIYG